MAKPSVLFVCVHNAGRSQMAAAFLTHLSDGAVEVRSAGSTPADQVNPAAVQAMAEVGIDITAEKPKILTDQAVRESDVVITMGCGDTCPFYPGKRYEDWVLDDPAGQGVEAVRPIRDEIRRPGRGTHQRTGRRRPNRWQGRRARHSDQRQDGSYRCEGNHRPEHGGVAAEPARPVRPPRTERGRRSSHRGAESPLSAP